MGNPRDIRKAARVSQLVVAAATGTSLPTVSKYEANPAAVAPDRRAALDPYYAQLAARTEASSQ
jgi:transcriptional regulator with XRE-family HTH domain